MPTRLNEMDLSHNTDFGSIELIDRFSLYTTGIASFRTRAHLEVFLRDLCKTPPFAQFSAVAKAMAGQAALGSNFNPQNTQCIPVVKILACLELESRFSGKHFSKVSLHQEIF